MKRIILLLLVIFLKTPQHIIAQSILWNRVPKSEIDPKLYSTKGKLMLNNGDDTNSVDLIIDFEEKNIYYNNIENNISFNLGLFDYYKISIPEFKNGEFTQNTYFFGEFSEEIGASFRKKTYNNFKLNEVRITSIKKRGFLNISTPKFYVTSSGLLDIENKADITCKILSISPNQISYLDSDGDLWTRDWKKAKNQTINSLDGIDKKREERKMARILNILFNDSKYLSINDLYNKFYKEYQIEYFKSIKQFEKELLGKNIKQIVSLWGPFSEKQIIDNNTSQYVWTYKKHITSTVGTSNSTSLIEKNENSLVDYSTSGNIFSESNITSKSNYYSNGLGIVKDSYANSSGDYFLNFYSKNILYSNSVTLSQNTSNYSSLSIESEESKKIALLVDENNLIIEVLTKNFFSEPDYGITISFIDL